MSSGPELRKENPRSGWSRCIDETPMSRRMPSTEPGSPHPILASTFPRFRKSSLSNWTRDPNGCKRDRQRSRAEASRSIPRHTPSGADCVRMASRCPPAPAVASTYRPPGRGSSRLTTFLRRTGTCAWTSRGELTDQHHRRSSPQFREIADQSADGYAFGMNSSRPHEGQGNGASARRAR